MDDAVALQAKSDVKGRALRLFEDWLSHDGPLSKELSDRMESAVSELGTLSSEFATGQNPSLFTASGLTVLAADFLGGLGRREEAIMNLLEMERLCHESNRQCFNGMLECAWMRAQFLLDRGDSETEAAKAALLHCLALGEENKQKFEEGTLEDVDSLIKRVKYSLGKLYLSTSEGDASDPIPLLMVAEEEDEYFDKAETHYLLGSAHLNTHRISGSVQDLKVGIDYLKSSFTISRAKDDTGTVFSRSNKVGKFLLNGREFGHSLEMFKEAAAFAKTVGSQNWAMEFWLNCGRVLLEEEKYEEAVEYFTASLEIALQMTDEQKEKHIEIAYKLLYGTQLLLRGSLTKDEFYKDTITTSQFVESEVKAGERRALAMFSIGFGKFLQGQEAEGCHYLQDTLDFVNTLQVQGEPDSNLHMLIYQIQMSLAGMYRHSTNLEAAANLYKTCAAMVDKPSHKLKCIYNEVEALIASFHYVEAMEVVNTALEWSYALVDTEWAGVALLLSLLGVVLYLCGCIEEAISKLLEACKYWEEKRAFEDEGLAYAYICLFQAYLVNQEYRQAFEFAKHIQPVLEQYHSEDDILVRWKALNGTGYMLLGDQVAGVKYLTLALDEAKHKGDWQLQLAILGNLARAYKSQKKFTSALAKYEEMEVLCSEPEGTAVVQLRAEMSINRGDTYVQLAQQDNTDWQHNCQLGLQEYKKATEILACQPFTEHLQAMAYAGQAVLLYNLQKGPEAQEMVGKALKLAGQDRLLIARLKYIEAHTKEAVADAIVITREAALLFAAVQMELQDLEVAWVTLFGSQMKHMFIMLQRLYVDAEEYTKALLWAERGRMRLFQHKIEGNQVSHLLELAERGKGTNNSAIHRSRMVVDNGARKVLPELESVFTDLDHMHLNQPGSGGTAKGGDIPMPDTCDLGASENNFMEEIISGGLQNDLKHMKVGFGQNLEDIVEQSSASEAIAMDRIETNQHTQQEYRSTWEGEAWPGTMSAGVSSADPLWFDKNDSLAEKLIFQTLGECGQGTAVVEYMYADDENLLFAYVLRPGVDCLIHCHRTILKAFFQGKERTKMGTTLLALVTNTRTAIMKHQKRALLGLQILAELLVAPVRDHIWDCSNIIFAPHEILHSVPFCALHNKETFLIQEKTISLIPSVRALHQCFIQQQAFEVACRNETVGPAFVAGNPEPMGLGLDQLKGAAEEAEEVAELLNVEAIVGGRVTKEAVIKGLSSACLVVLGTHGIVDPAHPHGALVLQDCKPLLSVSQKATSELNGDGSSSLRSARQRLFGRGSLEKAVATASETLTPEEITALPGGVHTGLVVLSACQTGKGEVTSEGVFSLWRALLQAGAPAVIVSLWKVDDGSTKALIKDLFTGLAKDGKPLAEALQSAMVHMLNNGHHNVFHWAPFVVVGSPFLKIPNFSCMAKLSSIQVKDE